MTYKSFVIGCAVALACASGVRAQAAGDQAFVSKIAGVGMGEVELGRLAVDKAASREVKAFGQRMIDEHTKAGNELKAIAQRKNLAWPAGPAADLTALKDRLAKMSGAAFDRAYIDAMVNGHREVAEVMRKESQSGSDPEVKAWATKALSTVQAHLNHALDQQRELGKTATN
jgi:putative membrane protein